MPKFQLAIPAQHPCDDAVEVIDTADLNSALAVLDINLAGGEAQIMADGKPLARLRRCGKGRQSFWEIDRSDAVDEAN